LKILNVFDTGGQGAIFGKYGNDNIITYQTRQLDDKFHIDSYYTNVVMFPDSQTLLAQAFLDQDHYDHIVVHAKVVELKEFTRHPSVTIHHNGAVLRGSRGECEDRTANRVFVSTKDLIHWRGTAIHIPTPVDTELFNNIGIGNGGLMINRIPDKDLIEDYVYTKLKGVEYRVRDNQHISYENMPELLRRYSFYVDTKYTYEHPPILIKGVLSGTALQALSCGLTVFGPDLEPRVGLPLENRGQTATEYFIKALNNDI